MVTVHIYLYSGIFPAARFFIDTIIQIVGMCRHRMLMLRNPMGVGRYGVLVGTDAMGMGWYRHRMGVRGMYVPGYIMVVPVCRQHMYRDATGIVVVIYLQAAPHGLRKTFRIGCHGRHVVIFSRGGRYGLAGRCG